MGTVPSFPYQPSTDFASQVNPQQEDPNSALLKELSRLRQEQDIASAQNQATLDAGTAKIDSYFNDRMTKLEAIRNDVMKPREITPQQILSDLVKLLAAGFLGRNPALAVGLSGLGNLVKTSDPKFQEYEQRQKFGKELMDQFLQEGNARGNALLQQVGLSVNNANAALGRKTDLATAGLNLQGELTKDRTNKQFQINMLDQEHRNRIDEQQLAGKMARETTLAEKAIVPAETKRKQDEDRKSAENITEGSVKATADELDPNRAETGKIDNKKVIIGSPEFETFLTQKYKEYTQNITDNGVMSNLSRENFRNKIYDEVKARGWYKEKFDFRKLNEQIDNAPEDIKQTIKKYHGTGYLLNTLAENLKHNKEEPNKLFKDSEAGKEFFNYIRSEKESYQRDRAVTTDSNGVNRLTGLINDELYTIFNDNKQTLTNEEALNMLSLKIQEYLNNYKKKDK